LSVLQCIVCALQCIVCTPMYFLPSSMYCLFSNVVSVLYKNIEGQTIHWRTDYIGGQPIH
jgi:hypothetical protein